MIKNTKKIIILFLTIIFIIILTNNVQALDLASSIGSTYYYTYEQCRRLVL